MRRRRLTPEDRDIWSRYTRTAEALPQPRHGPAETMPSGQDRTTGGAGPEELSPFRLGERATARTGAHALAPSISEEIRAAPIRMDAKAHKRMITGKLRPEGKLDLHGMTLDQAHPELARFILMSHAAGKRLVIVVTGKGKSRPVDGPIPTRPGVLKHQVPQWLRMAPLASVVLQVSEAHRRHGGSGAYYVYLRR
ncbi:Smr/MutS family protein [uncultured Jannaschia sp.]|uniref:Smr/MutS family protein n=1 Tax=uncultured Jannaschia sp. TaxID=293347 RepID=UPI00260554B0|nr:Smr/MutS family protein [uncultured Jannaschia sp.]